MMFSMRNKVFALGLMLTALAGCSSTETMPDQGAGSGSGSDVTATDQNGGSTVYGGDQGSGVSSSGLSDQERMDAQENAQKAEQAAMRKITTFYFDFDTSEIKPEARDVLIAHAQYLANNPDQHVRLEGHADERGTKEYNLALGERRANAVERFLIVNGASRNQIETVSYGEEKPAVMGTGESVWAQNRRVELIFQ